jgi:hypothetical protein
MRIWLVREYQDGEDQVGTDVSGFVGAASALADWMIKVARLLDRRDE